MYFIVWIQAEKVHVDFAQQAYPAAVRIDPCVEGRNGVIIRMLCLNAE
jgi:hypothetical protein